MAAYLASQWTGIPYMLKHAGSDLGRLMKQRGLTTAYREILRQADSVWTGSDFAESFLAMGVKQENIWPGRTPQVPEIFSPQARPLDLNGLLKKLAASEAEHVRNALINTSPIDLSKPTIGIYGKVGEVKGSFDLLRALRLLKQRGSDFNFLALTQGRALPGFKRAISELELQDRTWIFPFLPHWKVPGFIRACTAVCFLEREFPISFHGPIVPNEVLACGTPLIVSREIANKQHRLKDRFVDGENILIVDDPKRYEDLAGRLSIVIHDPEKAKIIGAQGHRLRTGAEEDHTARRGRFETYVDALEQEWTRIVDNRKTKRLHRADDAGSPERLRREKLKARLPWTSLLLDGQWNRLVDEYCSQGDASTAGQFMDALGFCKFLELKLAELGSRYEYFVDVFRYEKTHNSMLVDGDAECVSTPVWAPAPGAPIVARKPRNRKHSLNGDISELRPAIAGGIVVHAFSYDLQRLAAQFRQGKTPRELPKNSTFIVFKKELNFINLEFRINHTTKDLLDLCTGEHTVRTISKQLAAVYQGDGGIEGARHGLAEQITKLVRELTSKGIIELRAVDR